VGLWTDVEQYMVENCRNVTDRYVDSPGLKWLQSNSV
jgi:hypothetical protein